VPGTPSSLSDGPVGERKARSVVPQNRSSLAAGSSGARAHASTGRQRSRERFKPAAVAGNERGESSVSGERLSELSIVYGISPDRLLADALRRSGGAPK
jgi:hypothetical protein